MVQQGLLAFILVFSLAWQGCSAGKPNPAHANGSVTNYTACFLPKDQGTGSLFGRWGSTPVSIVFDRDFYMADNGEAVPALRAAVQTWNSWSRLKSLNILSISNDGTGAGAGRDIPVTTDCSQATITAATTDVVGIWKIRSGGEGKNKRDSCSASTGGKLLPDVIQANTEWTTANGVIVGGSILLNFDGWNSPGRDSLDVESLFLHELGHILGLYHSCNNGNGDATAAPGCTAATTPIDYITAAMFPFLSIGKIRRTLGQNDYNRINCLY